MTKYTLITLGLFLLLLAACRKKNDQTVTIVEDCTGTYLRWQEAEYKVCNLEKVQDFQNGMQARASFKKIKNCTESASEMIICARPYAHEGWIEVLQIQAIY